MNEYTHGYNIRRLVALPGLQLRGLHCYNGAIQHTRKYEDMAAKVARVVELTKASVAQLQRENIPCPIVTGGGTG